MFAAGWRKEDLGDYVTEKSIQGEVIPAVSLLNNEVRMSSYHSKASKRGSRTHHSRTFPKDEIIVSTSIFE